MDSESAPSNLPSDQPVNAESLVLSASGTTNAFELFKQVQWWRGALNVCVLFVPKCLLPVGLYLLFIAICFGALPISSMALSGPDVTFVGIMQAMFTLLAALLVCVPIFVACFGIWVTRLTAFAYSFNKLTEADLLQPNDERIKSLQTAALVEIKPRKAFLAKFWTMLTLILIVPFVVFTVSFMMTGYSSYAEQVNARPATASPIASSTLPAPILGAAAVPGNTLNGATVNGGIASLPTTPAQLPPLPPQVAGVATVVMIVSGLYVSMMTFVGLFVSATTTELKAGKAAMESVKLTHQYLLPLTLICVVVLVVNVVITAPREIIDRIVPLPWARNNLAVSCAEEVWRGISSIILFTFSVTPVCEFLKSKQK